MEIKSLVSVIFLAVSLLITLWIWAFLEQIRWASIPFGPIGGPGVGAALARTMTLARWLTLSIAFVFLLWTGRLDGWAHYAALRILLTIGGITLLEGSMFAVDSRCVDESLSPHLRLLFKCLVVLLPSAVIAGGYFGSRDLFISGAVASLTAAVWPLPKYIAPPPDQTSVEYILQNVNPEEDKQDILARLDKHPGWERKAARALERTGGLTAAFLVTLRPAELSEDVQERCWKEAVDSFARARFFRDRGENWMPQEFVPIAPIVQGLASIPGPVRDRHRADFIAIQDFVNFYRVETPERRYPELPDLKQVDWRASGV
jgi:hypothetical protein